MSQSLPKILVLSHNCFSDSSANGRTLSALFRNFDNSKISQFFVNSEIPQTSVCNSFFRTTDNDLIRSYFQKKEAGSQFFGANIEQGKRQDTNQNRFISKIKNFKKFFPSFLYIFRNTLWSIGKWDNSSFNKWIDDFNPDIILLQPGDYSFLYKIARVISKRKSVPIIVYNSEDYYLKNKFSLSPIFYFQRFFFKREVNKTFNSAKLIIYSNDLLENNLHPFFKCKSSVILTSSEIEKSQSIYNDEPLSFLYAGNLGHERWKSLLKIAEEIRLIDGRLSIKVYSSSVPYEAKKHFSLNNGINYKGTVSYSKVIEEINNSDVVIHTEGFSKFTKWDIRHGFSTKIADLLSSGKCFLMYGPKEVSCVDYLIKNEAAWVATSDIELKNALSKIINNVNTERNKFLKRAKELVDERHNFSKNCRIFENLIFEVYQNQHNNKS